MVLENPSPGEGRTRNESRTRGKRDRNDWPVPDRNGSDREAELADRRASPTIAALILYFVDPNGWAVDQDNLTYLDLRAFKTPSAQVIYSKLRAKGLLNDIRRSPLNVSPSCFSIDSGVRTERSASTLFKNPGSPICVSPWAIVEQLGYRLQLADIYEIMLHEYARHFGIRDFDRSFSKEVADILRRGADQFDTKDRQQNDFLKPYVRALQNAKSANTRVDRDAFDSLFKCTNDRTACRSAALSPLFPRP